MAKFTLALKEMELNQWKVCIQITAGARYENDSVLLIVSGSLAEAEED